MKIGHPEAAAVLLAVALTGLASSAPAQTFAGCVDLLGRPVISVPRPVGDVAVSMIDPLSGMPIIAYNPAVLSWLSPASRLFFLGHECAHHALGHTIGTTHPLRVEQDADCWSIRTLVARGDLSGVDVRTIQAELARVGAGDWTHLPGPQRAINLDACLHVRAASARGDSCATARDGECDEPDVCDPGTDSTDCRPSPGVSTPPRAAVRSQASVCLTSAGRCPMVAPVASGGFCTCVLPFGAIPGIAQ